METLPGTQFDNMYGPAEINGCTHYTVPRESVVSEAPIPIGPLNPICEGLVVDENNQPVADGEAGELLVKTPTRMRGYWGQPELTEQSIFRRKAGSQDEALYYRTGDLVETRKDGNLVFLGRKDRQVKSRGYRVELDEVERALASHEVVEEAAAFLVEDREGGDNRIEAAITMKSEKDVDPKDIDLHVRAALPAYAVPARISVRNQFPRTTTGKIDRRALAVEASTELTQNLSST